MIGLGSTYHASANVFDASNNPVNCATITLTITLPDATTISPVVVNPPAVTGQYFYDYVTAVPGRHQVRWVGTSPAVSYGDVFDVTEANPPTILSLADAKRQLGMTATFTGDDAELLEWNMAVTAAIENYKHEVIPLQAIAEEHNYGALWGRAWANWSQRPQARLWKYPAVSLVSIVSRDTLFTWNVENFDLDTDTGLVRLMQGPPLRGMVIINYLAGYRIIPYNYLVGARLLLQALWETRRGPGGVGGVIGPEELADYRHYTSMPRKVMEILGPPRPVVA